MALSREEVAGIAAYARIALDDAELDEMTSFMNDALALLAPLGQLDLEGVEPTFHPIGGLANVMAPDEADANGRSLGLDAALANAASTQGRAFRVPSILGDGEGER